MRDTTARIILCLLASVVLALGTYGRFPYGFYTLERFFVTGIAAWTAYAASKRGSFKLLPLALFGGVAVLFNPLIPVHLSRREWHPIDLIVAAVFAVEAVFDFVERTRLKRASKDG